jgi:hypothetical protein
MILDGLEGDPSAGCDAAGWFLCCGLLIPVVCCIHE